MLSLPTQASAINSECLGTLKNTSKNRHQGGYFASYYQNNRQSLLAYSHDYYQVKKLLASYLKEEKKSTDRHREGYWKTYQRKKGENDRHREGYWQDYYQKRAKEKVNSGVKCVGVVKTFSHTSIKEHSVREKELFFFRGRKKEVLVQRLDHKYLRLPTKNKIPQKKGWNQPWFEEWLDKSGLLKKYQEWSIRGGKKIGNKYLSFLDLDINKDDLESWRIKQLEKNARLFLDYLGCFYVKTKKGYHVYMLTDELISNEMIYHVDSWLKSEKIIGSIQSKGKYVVGFDSPDKKLVEKGKWFWHVKDLAQIKSTLEKFFLLVGRTEEKVAKKTDDCLAKLQQEISLKKEKCRQLFNTKKSPDIYLETTQKRIRNEVVKEPTPPSFKKSLNQVKILSKQKTCLEDIWKVFYLDQKTKTANYFLVNDYQKNYALSNLEVGSVKSMWLVRGFKHDFLSRINP